MTVEHYITSQTEKQAQLFAISLAELGYTSVIKKIRNGHEVESDGKVVKFTTK